MFSGRVLFYILQSWLRFYTIIGVNTFATAVKVLIFPKEQKASWANTSTSSDTGASFPGGRIVTYSTPLHLALKLKKWTYASKYLYSIVQYTPATLHLFY